MALLQTGPTTILSATAGTTQVTGSWFQIHPGHTELTFQVRMDTSSVGATAASTVIIQVANSTAIAVAEPGQTFALTATTDIVSAGSALLSTMRGNWQYVRAFLQSLTTSTAGSAGVPTVSVIANAGLRAV